eukprot:g6177.t1
MPLPTLKLYECYARLEDCIEKWEEVSEIGLRALSMVCQSVPQIEHLVPAQDHAINYPTFASKTEASIEVLLESAASLQKCLESMQEVMDEAKGFTRGIGASKDGVEKVLLNRGQSQSKCSASDWINFLSVQFEMYKADYQMKRGICQKITEDKVVRHNHVMKMKLMWEHQPSIDEAVVGYINERLKHDHVLS